MIAAKPKIANNSDSAPVASTIVDGDSLLSAFSAKLPYKVKTTSTAGRAMVNDATMLENYNNGLLTSSCVP